MMRCPGPSGDGPPITASNLPSGESANDSLDRCQYSPGGGTSAVMVAVVSESPDADGRAYRPAAIPAPNSTMAAAAATARVTFDGRPREAETSAAVIGDAFVSAREKSDAVAKRSAGSFANALSTAA